MAKKNWELEAELRGVQEYADYLKCSLDQTLSQLLALGKEKGEWLKEKENYEYYKTEEWLARNSFWNSWQENEDRIERESTWLDESKQFSEGAANCYWRLRRKEYEDLQDEVYELRLKEMRRFADEHTAERDIAKLENTVSKLKDDVANLKQEVADLQAKVDEHECIAVSLG